MKQIVWTPKKVKVDDLKENAQNPKVINDIGKKRLEKSLSKFGLAGTIVANKDLSIIDGHSRKTELKANGVKEVWVSVPSRQLTEKEYKEFNAIYDMAKASDVDFSMMSEEILDEWLMEEDVVINDKGDTAEKSDALYPIVPKFNEKYDAILILCTNETETSFVRTALNLKSAKDYKRKMIGRTMVSTAQNFIEQWQSK